MPNRIVRDGILRSVPVNDLSEAGEIFYRRLMSIVDDFGRCEADLDMLRLDLFARQLDRWPVERVRAALLECTTTSDPLVSIYTVSGKNYLEIQRFGQRTRPGQISKFPQGAGTCGNLREITASRARTTTPTPTPTPTEEEGLGETAASAIRLVAAIRNAEPPESEPSDRETDEFSAWAEAVYARHPKKKYKHLALVALQRSFARDVAARERFDRNHRAWCITPDWLERGGRFCPPLCDPDGHGFVNDDGWMHPPIREEPLPTATKPEFIGSREPEPMR